MAGNGSRDLSLLATLAQHDVQAITALKRTEMRELARKKRRRLRDSAAFPAASGFS